MRPYIVFILVLSALPISSCVSRSPVAQSATAVLGDWSPVGSQQISRQNRLALAGDARLYVGQGPNALRNQQKDAVNPLLSDALARQLNRYFSAVVRAPGPQNAGAALRAAAAAGADFLLLPRVESWPNIDPLSVHECADAKGESRWRLSPCEAADVPKDGELAFQVAVFDVRTHRQVDTLFAQGRRGASAYFSDRVEEDLQSLCHGIAAQLSPQGRVP